MIVKTPQKIKSIKDATPAKGQWYEYHGDIFVSVIPLKNKPHIRRKVSEMSNKKDNSTSQWHLAWQYEIIEAKYGKSAGGERTYEIPIRHQGELHYICLLYTSPSPRDLSTSRMPSSA